MKHYLRCEICAAHARCEEECKGEFQFLFESSPIIDPQSLQDASGSQIVKCPHCGHTSRWAPQKETVTVWCPMCSPQATAKLQDGRVLSYFTSLQVFRVRPLTRKGK